MAFQIDVGCDLYGAKVNTTLSFVARPSVAELTAACESYFDTRARATRPAGYPDLPVKIETMQLFDDTLLRWVDLYNEQQLKQGVQLWCFQPESIWHSDAQGVIPAPEKPPITWTTPLGSPRRARIAADAGVPPTLSEKLRSVFYQIDGSNKGYLLYGDLEAAFQRCDMQFNDGTSDQLFDMADQNRSQHITYDEWVNFAVRCPGIVDALFFRMRDISTELPPQQGASSPMVQRQSDLNKMYNDSWSGQNRGQQEAAFAEARVREAERRKVDAEGALTEHMQALQAAQVAAQQHAQQHAAARQAANEQGMAIDAAQQAMMSAEQASQAAAAQEAAARAALEQARAAKAQAEAALQAAQQQRLQAEQQADTEAAAQYAAEQHAQQQENARSRAQQAAQMADRELHDAAQAAQAQRAAAEAAAQAAHAQEMARQQAEQAAAQRNQLGSRPSAPPPQQQNYYPQQSMVQQPSMGAQQMSMGAPDDARRQYEASRARADELRRLKEQAEREEQEAWNKLYYSPASPHYLPGQQ